MIEDRYVLNHAGQPSHQLICWEPYSDKWIDPHNNYFCHALHSGSAGEWMVAARYGWPDGDRDPKIFADQTQALGWFVNFLYSRHVELERSYAK